MDRMVIVGGGLAGHQAAIALRKLDASAAITLLGDESGLPYDRPPLTKEFLVGSLGREAITLRDAGAYEGLGIEYVPGTAVIRIDRDAAEVVTERGTRHPYDRLLLATGARPRQMEGVAPSRRVHYIRTFDDAARLAAAIAAGGHLAIVGGGFIGLEIAAAARRRGCRVTVVEASERLLARTMPAPVGVFMRRLHEANGVEFLFGAHVSQVADGEAGIALKLSSCMLEADAAVIGIGVVPNTELAQEAGLMVRDGIVVDRHCRTSDPNICAAGEVTAHPLAGGEVIGRVESWRIAAEQPLVAAATMTGASAVFDDPPWMWTDQFEINLQAIGMPQAGVQYRLVGSMAEASWTLLCLDARGELAGAVAANRGRDISRLRRLIRSGAAMPAEMLEGAVGLP